MTRQRKRKVSKQEAESIAKGMQDMVDGYTYTYLCKHRDEKGPCFNCHTAECERWYLMGIRDAKKGYNRLTDKRLASRRAKKGTRG